MQIHAVRFTLIYNINTTKIADQKASDHSDVDMFAPALKWNTPVESRLFI